MSGVGKWKSSGSPGTVVLLDGAMGEGGGQVLRTALSLSVITGRPLSIKGIRANRERSGLLRQHLTGVLAAAAISSAEVVGAELGSTELSFRPGPVVPGKYAFKVGTAGSACLVVQTVLLPLALAAAPSEFTVEGGTHNRWAPPFDALDEAWLPQVRAMGFRVRLRLEQHGFFPAGGGRVVATTEHSDQFVPLALEARGAIVSRRARALISQIPESVGVREIDTIMKHTSLVPDECSVDLVSSTGPGNAVVLTMRHEHGAEVFTGFGEQGRRAEAVATQAVQAMQAWHGADVPVGPHLADQLLLPMALAAGGTFRTQRLTPHTTTNAAVIAAFLGDVVTFADETPRRGSGTVRVTVQEGTGPGS